MSKHAYLTSKNAAANTLPPTLDNPQSDHPTALPTAPPPSSLLTTDTAPIDFKAVGGKPGTIPTSLADEDEAWLNSSSPPPPSSSATTADDYIKNKYDINDNSGTTSSSSTSINDNNNNDIPISKSEKLLMLEVARQGIERAASARERGKS
jgi:hypothetical protein